ncbi:hypothetical protein FOC1_g10002466 [Fusarium oxysporum f. sp. cubense race 1]|uniref:Uncharacterized protein n=1 Tax=Fusarium oxysporum f. sp. cubense (strain race 1) TaxID=1229664 RepID=N4V1F3_FUSC1|nr:hypothetical protein FOC1_g10002466 [Fusarium oxysporum f. sp. cubense race 1]
MANFSTWPTALPAKQHILSRILPFLLFIVPQAVCLTTTWLLLNDIWAKVFCTLFTLCYTRLVGHIIGYCIYRPSLIKLDPLFIRSDVTVIILTVNPKSRDFHQCVQTIIANQPACLLVVAVGGALREECINMLCKFDLNSNTNINVTALSKLSKRYQITYAMPYITTTIIIFANNYLL